MNQWKEYIPRKIRRVSNGRVGGTQYLISLPETIAERYNSDVMFTCTMDGSNIVLTPVNVPGVDSDAA